MKCADASIAAVIYVPVKPDSVRHADALRRLGDSTVIGETMRRLRRGLGDIASHFAVLGHDDRFSHRIGAEAERSQFQHAVISSEKNNENTIGVAEALQFLAQHNPTATDFLVFSETSAFPDCQLARALLDQHLEHKSDCTVADYPFGLVPLAVRVAALNNCAGLELPPIPIAVSSVLELFIYQLRFASATAAKRPPERALKIEMFPGTPISASIRATLPLRMSVQDRYTWLAAQRVQSNPDYCALDSTPACAFKREMLPLLDVPRPVDFRPQPVAKNGPVTVLVSSLRTAYSGPEQCLLALMAGFDRNRFRPVLALPVDCLVAERARELGIPVEVLDLQFERCSPAGLNSCHHLLDKYEVRLVHLDTYPNAALVMAAYHRNIPMIGHLRGPVPEDIPDVAYCVDRIVTVSEFIAESLRKTYMNPDKIRVIHDGVETQRFANVRKNRARTGDANVFKVAMVARITPCKRQDLLIQALALLRNSKTKVQAFLFGDLDPGMEKYSAQLNQFVRERQLEDCISFCGFEGDLERIYQLADALVVCNAGEPLGTCTLEALASGIPVVAPNSGGSCEIVRHEKEGLLFAADKADELAGQIARLAGDPDLYQTVAAGAAKRAESFDVTCHVARIQDLYEELLDGKASVPAQGSLWQRSASADQHYDPIQQSDLELSTSEGHG
jgi:glycosyltransferase involved in cell wall biosynthesis